MSYYHKGPFASEKEAKAAAAEAEVNSWTPSWWAEYHEPSHSVECEGNCQLPEALEALKGWYAVARNEQGYGWTGAPWAPACSPD